MQTDNRCGEVLPLQKPHATFWLGSELSLLVESLKHEKPLNSPKILLLQGNKSSTLGDIIEDEKPHANFCNSPEIISTTS